MLTATKEKLSDFLSNLFVQTGGASAWNGLAKSDRRAIKLLGLVLVLSVFYFFVWEPIHLAADSAEKQRDLAKSEWHWLAEQAEKLNHQESSLRQLVVKSQSQLTQVVQSSLKQHNLYRQMSGMKPMKVNNQPGVQVLFDQVDAPRFFRWLSQLEKQGVLPYQMSSEKHTTKGKIIAIVKFQVKR